MAERRSKERFRTDDIGGSMVLAANVDVLNLSLSGAAIECDRRLNIGNRYTFKFKDASKTLAIEGLVVWSVLGRSARLESGEAVPIYKIGLQFSDILTEKARTLVELIESHKKTEELRLGGSRFDMYPPVRAFLDYSFEYKTKKISLKEMLIEAEHELPVGREFPMRITSGEETCSFLGKVSSCEELPDTLPGHWLIKIDFVGMSEENRDVLKRFIAAR